MDVKSRKNRTENKTMTGSPNQGEPVFLAIGIIQKPHGIQGEVRIELYSDFPERITAGKLVYLGEDHKKIIIRSVRFMQNSSYISLVGINSREDSERIRNQVIYVRSDELPALGLNNYYHHQIIGLDVIDINKVGLGKIIDIIRTGSNDVYVVSSGRREDQDLLIPALQSVIINVDLEKSIMIVKLPVWG